MHELVKNLIDYPTHISLVPTPGINNERSLIVIMWVLVLAFLNINLWLKIDIHKCKNQHTLRVAQGNLGAQGKIWLEAPRSWFHLLTLWFRAFGSIFPGNILKSEVLEMAKSWKSSWQLYLCIFDCNSWFGPPFNWSPREKCPLHPTGQPWAHDSTCSYATIFITALFHNYMRPAGKKYFRLGKWKAA
jgi:hypothetical protein